MANEKIGGAIFEAIDLIVDKKIGEAQFDRTLTCTVKSCKNPATGLHELDYGGTTIAAYAQNNTVYSLGDTVYVLVPGNNMGADKKILGSVGAEKNVSSAIVKKAKPIWVETNLQRKQSSEINLPVNSEGTTIDIAKEEDKALPEVSFNDSDALVVDFDILTTKDLADNKIKSGDFSISLGGEDLFTQNDILGYPYKLGYYEYNTETGVVTYLNYSHQQKVILEETENAKDVLSKLSGGESFIWKAEGFEPEITNAYHIKNLKIYAANEGLETAENCSVNISAPNGFVLDNLNENLVLAAQFIAGESEEEVADYQWFIKDASVKRKGENSENWRIAGMSGWKYIGSGQNVSFSNTILFNNSDWYSEVEIKCVAITKSNRATSDQKVVYKQIYQPTQPNDVEGEHKLEIKKLDNAYWAYSIGKIGDDGIYPTHIDWVALKSGGSLLQKKKGPINVNDTNETEDGYYYAPECPFEISELTGYSLLRCAVYYENENENENKNKSILLCTASMDLKEELPSVHLSYVNNIFVLSVDENSVNPESETIYLERFGISSNITPVWYYSSDNKTWTEIKDFTSSWFFKADDNNNSLTVNFFNAKNEKISNPLYIKCKVGEYEDATSIITLKNGTAGYDLTLSNELVMISANNKGEIYNTVNDSISGDADNWYIDTDISLYLGADRQTLLAKDIELPTADSMSAPWTGWVEKWVKLTKTLDSNGEATYEEIDETIKGADELSVGAIRAYIKFADNHSSADNFIPSFGTATSASKSFPITITKPIEATVSWNWSKINTGEVGRSLRLVSDGNVFKIKGEDISPDELTMEVQFDGVVFNKLNNNNKNELYGRCWYKVDDNSEWKTIDEKIDNDSDQQIYYQFDTSRQISAQGFKYSPCVIHVNKSVFSGQGITANKVIKIGVSEDTSEPGKNSNKFYDIVSINNVVDGESVYSINVDNPNVFFDADSKGNLINLNEKTINFQLYLGTKNIEFPDSVLGSSLPTTVSGLNFGEALENENKNYKLTIEPTAEASLTEDSGTFDITFKISDNVSITKTISWNKNKQGAKGSSGDGTRWALAPASLLISVDKDNVPLSDGSPIYNQGTLTYYKNDERQLINSSDYTLVTMGGICEYFIYSGQENKNHLSLYIEFNKQKISPDTGTFLVQLESTNGNIIETFSISYATVKEGQSGKSYKERFAYCFTTENSAPSTPANANTDLSTLEDPNNAEVNEWYNTQPNVSNNQPYVWMVKQTNEVDDDGAFVSDGYGAWTNPVLIAVYAGADLVFGDIFEKIVPTQNVGTTDNPIYVQDQGTFRKSYWIHVDVPSNYNETTLSPDKWFETKEYAIVDYNANFNTEYNENTEDIDTKLNKAGYYEFKDGLFVNASMIKSTIIESNLIKSNNYEPPSLYTSPFSVAGTFLDLQKGTLTSPGLSWDSNGIITAKGLELEGPSSDRLKFEKSWSDSQGGGLQKETLGAISRYYDAADSEAGGRAAYLLEGLLLMSESTRATTEGLAPRYLSLITLGQYNPFDRTTTNPADIICLEVTKQRTYGVEDVVATGSLVSGDISDKLRSSTYANIPQAYFMLSGHQIAGSYNTQPYLSSGVLYYKDKESDSTALIYGEQIGGQGKNTDPSWRKQLWHYGPNNTTKVEFRLEENKFSIEFTCDDETATIVFNRNPLGDDIHDFEIQLNNIYFSEGDT